MVERGILTVCSTILWAVRGPGLNKKESRASMFVSLCVLPDCGGPVASYITSLHYHNGLCPLNHNQNKPFFLQLFLFRYLVTTMAKVTDTDVQSNTGAPEETSQLWHGIITWHSTEGFSDTEGQDTWALSLAPLGTFCDTKAWSQRTQQHLKVIPRECFQPEELPDVSQADVGRAPESCPCQHRAVSGTVLAPIECGFCGWCWEIYHTKWNQDLTWQHCWVLWKCWWAGCLAGRKGASVACNMCNRYPTHGYRLAEQIMPSFLFLNLQDVWLEQLWLLPVYENCWIPLLCFVSKFFFWYYTGLPKAIFIQGYNKLQVHISHTPPHFSILPVLG